MTFQHAKYISQLFFGAIYHLIDDNRTFLSIVESKLIVSLAFLLLLILKSETRMIEAIVFVIFFLFKCFSFSDYFLLR